MPKNNYSGNCSKLWNSSFPVLCLFLFMICSCSSSCSKTKDSTTAPPVVPPVINPVRGTLTLVNEAHLEHLTVPVIFPNGNTASGIYIYANAPSYLLADAAGEGFTCIDDVARAALFYLRKPGFATDTAVQSRAYNLIRFVVNMQSPNGYFYNFFQTGNTINTTGSTSVNLPKWWSWRALQALTEAGPLIRPKNAILAAQMDEAIGKLIGRIQTDLVNLPQTTVMQNGIIVPQWLPEGADAGATLLLGLIPYAQTSGDALIKQYIKKLADGIVLSQQGDAGHFPYSCFLSSGTLWHAYGSDQAHALFLVSKFLNDTSYSNRALAEVDHFYPWLLQNGFKYSFEIENSNGSISAQNIQNYEQIAYGVRPFVSAAVDALALTKDLKYADLAGQLSAWFFHKNPAQTVMYDSTTGRCFDAISAGNLVNRNAGAESCVEALLTMQLVEANPAVRTALNKYK
ncbi:hypothetical protein ACX0G9_15040 [Flavitalea flava]